MNKMKLIIAKEFDTRLDTMIIMYLLEKGIDFVKEIEDEEINKLDGIGIITKEVMQLMVRTSRKIARECSLFDDIIPYIAKRFNTDAFTISNDRLSELATCAIHALGEEEFETFVDDTYMEYEEAEYFGVENLYKELEVQYN